MLDQHDRRRWAGPREALGLILGLLLGLTVWSAAHDRVGGPILGIAVGVLVGLSFGGVLMMAMREEQPES